VSSQKQSPDTETKHPQTINRVIPGLTRDPVF